MTTTTSIHELIKAALVAEFDADHAVDGPADELPKGVGGLIEQSVVIWPAPGLTRYTRGSGESSGRDDKARMTCVGATRYDALAALDRVEAAIGGMRTSAKGGTLRQVLVTEQGAEPNADPVRHLIYAEYATTTKGAAIPDAES